MKSPDTLVLPPVEQVDHLPRHLSLTLPGETFVVLVETAPAPAPAPRRRAP